MNKNESAALAFVGIVLIVALGVMGYLSWRDNKAKSAANSDQEASISQLVLPQNQPTSSDATATSPVVSSTTKTVGTAPDPAAVLVPAISPAPGWEVYREAEYGVAGTFPDAWYEYDAVGLGGSLQFTSVPQSDATTGGMINGGVAEISIYRTPETTVQARAEDSLSGTEQGITTAEVAGVSVSVVAYDVASSENTLVAYVPHDGYLYRVILAYHGETQFADTFSQFLATFQFEN